MPHVEGHAVSGNIPPEIALRRMLQGTGLHAVRAGPNLYRLEHDPRPASMQRLRSTPAIIRAVLEPVDADGPGGGAILVTAQKRAQRLDTVAMSLTVVRLGQDAAGIAAPGSRDVSLASEGLAMTNLGPGRNRQFMRGVADSPFNGPSQSTVAVQLDNARVNFDAPDPDLRLIDVDRVELIKGPQGPLYGSGAIGGIYHIVTNPPELDKRSADVSIFSEAVQHGAVGGGGQAVLNLPLIADTLAVRAVGYGEASPGWIDDIGRRPNANSARIWGGRIALRWRPDPDWTIDLGGVFQNSDISDSQYVLARARDLERDAPVPEPNDNDFRMVHGTIEGKLWGLTLLSATSYVDHQVDYTQDASAAARFFGVSAPVRFDDNRGYSILNQEVRLSDPRGHWLVGAAFMQARDHDTAMVRDADDVPRPVDTLDRKINEFALFGEANLSITSRLKAALGARLFHTVAVDETTARRGQSILRSIKTGLSPSATLSWTLPGTGLLYLRYARTLRPGGLAPTFNRPNRQFDSDELGTLDLGTRFDIGRLTVAASGYYTVWNKVQSDYLLLSGLVSTRNAGRAVIAGFEASGAWSLGHGLEIDGGFTIQRAHLTHADTGLPLRDTRLPIAPDATARLAATQMFTLAGWQGHVSGQANYVGTARLTFDPGLDRQMGNFITTAMNGALSRGGLTFAARIDNVLDVKGDSFAFGNPFSIRMGQQYTPIRPRTLTLSVGKSW